jgi:uncharacterized membrane protein
MEGILLHPPLVHFAIVLPLVALFFQITYSVSKSNNYIYSQWSALILVVAGFAMIAAWYTGGLQGADVYPLLSEEGQATLKQHKNIGLYLMVATVILAVLKFAACKARNVILETVVLIGLLGISSALAYQGLIGGDVVYKYGGGVENHSDGMDCLAEQAEMEEEE